MIITIVMLIIITFTAIAIKNSKRITSDKSNDIIITPTTIITTTIILKLLFTKDDA